MGYIWYGFYQRVTHDMKSRTGKRSERVSDVTYVSILSFSLLDLEHSVDTYTHATTEMSESLSHIFKGCDTHKTS